MNAAEQLKKELANTLFDKEKVLAIVCEGIKHNGESCIYEPYTCGSDIRYGDCNIECPMNIGTAIASYLRGQGFRVRNDYHPMSGRFYGYVVTI